MSYKKSLLCFSLCISLMGLTQEKIIDYELSQNVSDRFIGATIHAYDKVVFSHTALINDNIIQHFYYSEKSKREIVANTSIDNKNGDRVGDIYRKSKYLVHHPKSNYLIDIFYWQERMNYYVIYTDVASGRVTVIDTIRKGINADLVYAGVRNDTSTIVHYMRGENAFNLYNISPRGTSKKTIRIEFNDDKSLKIRSVSNKRFLYAPFNCWIPPEVVLGKDIAYDFSNNFNLVIDDDDNSTWLIDLDYKKNTAKAKLFIHPKNNFHRSKAATILTDSLMVSAFSTDKSINFFFYNTVTDQLVGSFNLDKENFPKESNGIKYVKDFWERSSLADANLTYFLEKCKKSEIVLSGYRRNNEVFLTVGVRRDYRPSKLVSNNLAFQILGLNTDITLLTFDISFDVSDFSTASCDTKTAVWEKLFLALWSNRERFGGLSFIGDFAYYTVLNPYSKRVAVYRYNLYMP